MLPSSRAIVAAAGRPGSSVMCGGRPYRPRVEGIDVWVRKWLLEARYCDHLKSAGSAEPGYSRALTSPAESTLERPCRGQTPMMYSISPED